MTDNPTTPTVAEGAPAHMPRTALQAREDEAKDTMLDDEYAALLADALATPAL